MSTIEEHVAQIVKAMVKEELDRRMESFHPFGLQYGPRLPLAQDILDTFGTEPKSIDESFRSKPEEVECSRSCWFNRVQCLVAAGRLAKVQVGAKMKVIKTTKVKED